MYKVPRQKGNEGYQGGNHEEREAGNPGYMSRVWNKDVPDWKEPKLIPWVIQARDEKGVPAHALVNCYPLGIL